MALRSFLINAAVLVGATVLSVAAAETGMRYFYFGGLNNPTGNGPSYNMPHPTRVYSYIPNTESWRSKIDYTMRVNINSQGLRGPEIAADEQRMRIMVVGDSNVFASGVSSEQSLPGVIQSVLGSDRFVSINGGFPAYNSVQQLLFLKEHGLSFKPDLVVFAFSHENDMQTNHLPLYKYFKINVKRPVASLDDRGVLIIDTSYSQALYDKAIAKQKKQDNASRSFMARLIRWPGSMAQNLLNHSLLWGQLYRAGRQLYRHKQRDPNVLFGAPYLAEFSEQYSKWGLSAADYERLWADAWEVTAAVILEMKRISEQAGAQFVMVAMPAKLQVSQAAQAEIKAAYPELALDPMQINRKLAAWTARNGVAFIDPIDALIAAREMGVEGLFYGIDDKHMTARGQNIVGTYVAGKLQAMNLLR